MRRLLRERGEAMLALGLALASALEVAVLYLLRLDAPAAPVLPVAVLLPLALAWRTRAPLQVLVVVATGWVLVNALTGAYDILPTVFALLVAVYSAGAYARGRARAAAATFVLLLIAASAVRDSDGTLYSLGGTLIFYSALHAGLWCFGRAMDRRRHRERELLVQREERARTAVLEERRGIARELHDVVAHAISVIVLQARGARHELDVDPPAARRALDAIDGTASQALAEMRRLLAILRAEDESVPLAPQPSISHVDVLAAQIRDAGLPVEVRVEGELRELPPGLDVTAYRIVQEALTNALKHAGAARARVLIRYDASELDVEVVDTGAGSNPNDDGGGQGLGGMRERVAVFGGELEYGARPEGGFAVRARLPL